jgi:hypothetical protein
MQDPESLRGSWEPRAPTKRARKLARVMVALGLVLVVTGVVIGGEASAFFIAGAVIPGLAWAYLERGTVPPGSSQG